MGGDLVRHRGFATLMVVKNHDKIRVAILGPGDANSPARDIARRTPPALAGGHALSERKRFDRAVDRAAHRIPVAIRPLLLPRSSVD